MLKKINEFFETKRRWEPDKYRFFVCDPKVLDYIQERGNAVFERNPLELQANDGELFVFSYFSFWRPMDTLRDKKLSNYLWNNNQAKWILWQMAEKG